MKSPKTEKARLDRVTVKAIKGAATEIAKKIERNEKPEVSFPVRSLSNVSYDPKKGYFQIGEGRSLRTLTVNTARVSSEVTWSSPYMVLRVIPSSPR